MLTTNHQTNDKSTAINSLHMYLLRHRMVLLKELFKSFEVSHKDTH